MAKLGKNITFPIYKGDGTSFHNLVLHKSTYDSVVMSLSDKITGEVYYKDNNLDVSMNEYINVKRNPDDAQEEPVKYVLVNPPTILREGMVSENGQLNGMTKYSFVFYHPMYKLGNLPFTDIAVSLNERRFLSESREFNWIGTAIDYVAKMNKNLEGTEFVVRISENLYDQGVPSAKLTTLSDVLTFNDTMMDEALKIFYETYAIPYVVDQLPSTDSAYASGKRFLILVGLPYETIDDGQGNEFVFRFGQGVGLKNNSRTPRNNKIVTRVAGYGSEENIPYGYPQIRWFGPSDWTNTKNDPTDPTSYPIYEGIVGGALVKLIKHPFTRTHLMPTVYVETLFNKVSPYNPDGTINTDYDPNTTLVDYYDATAEDDYPNPINPFAPSYESHEFADIKPQLGHETAITGATPLNDDLTPATDWDDSLDDDGKYKQNYFKISLPQLSFDLYACAAITQEMNIVMRGGACLGCTFPVQIDWDEYKKNFYRADGTFDPVPHTTAGDLHVRDITKFPNSSQGAIDVILKKENSTFGTLMPNVYQKPMTGDEIVFTGISLPQSYIDLAQALLDDAMKQWMLENNVHYWDYPLKFDEQFLSNNTDILLQLRPNVAVTFVFANAELTLYVKQLTIKYGEKVLPQYDITLTDNIEAARSSIGQAQADITKIDSGLSRINSVVEDITRNERIKATGSDMRPVYINGNNVPQEVDGIDVPENIRTEKNVEAMGGVAAHGMATLQRGGGGGMGTVTGINVNGTLYEPSNGLITLPNYPTAASLISDGLASQSYVQSYFSDNFTQANIKSTLGIYDWALAAYKPSYYFSEIGSKPTTLAGYGITDAHITSGVITLGGDTITPATLTNGKIPLSQIPDAILGQLIYGGTVNGSGVVTLSQNAMDKWGITSLTLTSTNYSTYEGAFFIASADATSGVPSTLGLLVGDWVVATASGWGKIDNTDAVTGVKGDAESSYRIGNVNITKGNIGLGNVENTALSTWAGTSNITTLGTIATGVWHGTAITDDYIASASAWNAKYDKPSGGIPKTDLASDVQTSLGKADTALQSHQTIYNLIIMKNGAQVGSTYNPATAAQMIDITDVASANALSTVQGYFTNGVANNAARLSNTSKIGDTNQPVYFTANGVPAAISYTIGRNVAANEDVTAYTGSTYINVASHVISAKEASGSQGGVVTTSAQTFAGDKTFNDNIQSMKGVAARGMATLQRSGGGGSGTLTEIQINGTPLTDVSGVVNIPLASNLVNGAMSSADKSKLDNIEAYANNYVLPAATANALGGVKVGTNLSIDANGVLSAVDTTYSSLPAASGGTAVSLVTTGEKYLWNNSFLPLTGGTLSGNLEVSTGSPKVIASNTSHSTAIALFALQNAGIWDNVNSKWAFGYDPSTGAIFTDAGTIWHSGNDGSGSGLDADLLDGQHGSYYAAASSLSNYLPLSGGALTGTLGLYSERITSSGSWNVNRYESKIRLLYSFDCPSDAPRSSYVSGLSVMTAYNGFQFATYGGDDDYLYFRKSFDSSPYWSSWKTVAFLDSNVASATYATSAGNADTVDGEHSSAFLHLTGGTLTGATNFNNYCWVLNGSEYNDIINKHWANETLYNNTNTALLSSNASIRNAIRFGWYDTYWNIGNIRGGNVNTEGFGIALEDTTNNRLIDCFRVTSGAAYVCGNTVIHSGNIGSQSVSYATSAGYVDKTDTSNWDADSPDTNSYLWYYGQSGGVTHFPHSMVGSYGSVATFFSGGTSQPLHAQLAWGINHDSSSVSHGIAWRAKNDLGWDATWHRLYDDNHHPLADAATQLQTSRSIWGQSFNGTGDVSGDMSNVGWINSVVHIGYQGNARLYIQGVSDNLDYLKMNVSDSGATQRHLVLQDYGGNVGIGATSPQAKLHVVGDSILGGSVSGVTTIDSLLSFDTANYRVGIGTIYPSTTLDVSGGLAAEGLNLKYGDQINCTSSIHNGLAINYYNGKNTTTPTKFYDGQYNEVVRITGDGRLGIGTETPSEKLHVAGNILANGNIVANGGVAARGMATLQGGAGTGNPVTQINVGSTAYTPSNGVVSLPAYPTWSTLSGKPSNVSAFTNDSGYIDSSALAVTFTTTTLTSSSTSVYLNNTVQRDTLQKIIISSANNNQQFNIHLRGSGSYYGYHRQVYIFNQSGKDIYIQLTSVAYISMGTYVSVNPNTGPQLVNSNPISMDDDYNYMYLLDIIQADSSEYPIVKITHLSTWAD